MKDKVDGVVEGTVVGGRSFICPFFTARIRANVLKEPEKQVKNLRGAPANDEGDYKEK